MPENKNAQRWAFVKGTKLLELKRRKQIFKSWGLGAVNPEGIQSRK